MGGWPHTSKEHTINTSHIKILEVSIFSVHIGLEEMYPKYNLMQDMWVKNRVKRKYFQCELQPGKSEKNRGNLNGNDYCSFGKGYPHS